MTKHIGSLGDALLRAFGHLGDTGAVPSLAPIAHKAIRDNAPQLKLASDAVEKAVRENPALMLEILDEARFTRALIERYVSRHAARIEVGLRADGAGQQASDIQSPGARPSKHRDAATAAGGGQTSCDTQGPVAPAENAAPSGKRDRANQVVTPRRCMPGHARRSGKAVSGAARASRRTVLDLLRVNGQPLRDVTAGEALAFAEKSRTDSATIERICSGLREKQAVGEQITDEQAEERAKR